MQKCFKQALESFDTDMKDSRCTVQVTGTVLKETVVEMTMTNSMFLI